MVEQTNVVGIAKAVAEGRCSAVDVVRACLDRIERIDSRLNAFISFDGERAIDRAKSVDAARSRKQPIGPLAGVPIALKDNIVTSFGATTCGSRLLENFEARYAANVADRLESAGAIIIGKTNLDEFAMGGSTEHSVRGVTVNPWETDRVAGGSSGGSAAAVAANLVPASLGSDTGGSIRQPASYCGVVGLKPSYGRVSRYGLVAYASSLDQIGPITRTVRDAALMLGVIAGHDRRDSTSLSEPVPDYLAALDRPLSGVRIGVADEHFDEGLDPEVADAVRASVALLEGEGAKIVPIRLPHVSYAIACYYLIATSEASSNLARFDGVHYGRRTPEPKDIIDLYASSRGEGFGQEVKRRIMLGTFALSSGYHDAYYLKASKVRTLIKRDFDAAFDSVDLIASPVAPTPAFRIGEFVDDPLAMYLADIYTVPANLAGHCAISLPCGFSSTGLPIGLQLSGRALGEETLLAAAHQFQLRTDFHLKTPSVTAA